MYVYIKSSPTTWTVGFYTNEGERWNAESDHFSEEAAQRQVAYLNGRKDFTEMSTVKELADERNALRDEVAELNRKLAEVEGERDALLALNAEMLAALNGYAYGIKSCGHNLVCICNQVKAEAIIAKIEGREINPWLRNSPAK